MIVRLRRHRALGQPLVLVSIILVILVTASFLLRSQRYKSIQLTDATDFTKPPTATDGATTTQVHEVMHSDAEADNHQEVPTQEEFEEESRELLDNPDAGAIYGNTLETLVDKEKWTTQQKKALARTRSKVPYSLDKPYIFNPYPQYNSRAWKASHSAYTSCLGPTGKEVEDIQVFKGHPAKFPQPGFGSYELLGIDKNLCFERETRLGPYGVAPVEDKNGQPVDWDNVDWGELQLQCLDKNKGRFATEYPSKSFSDSDSGFHVVTEREHKADGAADVIAKNAKRWWDPVKQYGSPTNMTGRTDATVTEPKSAVLLRSYTGKKYTENDKQVIRSMVTELSLRTGGQYQVFLFVHVKEDRDIWSDDEVYEEILDTAVPVEFRGMTVLWDEASMKLVYPKLSKEAIRVHNAQFLSVQVFMQKFREFDYVWNWEVDSRLTGHHYDFLAKLEDFSRKQPRKGLWERNGQFYIPSYHGDYNTEFRKTVEDAAGQDSVWGAPKLPVVNPIGTKPLVSTPELDRYEWGVGEEADLITLSPMFNPIDSNWVLRDQVWGYPSDAFSGKDLPRRATIITQARLSRKLVDVMHAENLKGNHVGSEMVAPTTALIHGLKAVYAPMPVFFDRPWNGTQLARWFNGGPRGQSGGLGSAMGWGREGRFQGATWYFRAVPPPRLYHNWMGYEDTGIGGAEWERSHGRPCLPAMFLHPLKDVRPTPKGYTSESRLPY
ncbi:hypothetical protein SMACR_06541 [Sordaria macrospora]|uniref:Major facilitator superfamily transporter n=1 Tax=Sordaria macrospora TaxID=5147 RepID=A0A8S8ZW62_SORMA|nr:hypothetical protein SMACR_06541 [Sordaria macrospora]WPJ60112.1 hypothetical protein SMAC4_06541 [Sordaria macrospora]